MKLTKEKKIQLYYDRLGGETWPSLSAKYETSSGNLRYQFYLIDIHGTSIHSKVGNRKYSRQFKEDAINRVLIDGEASRTVSLELALPNQGILPNWIRMYKENGYNVIEKKRRCISMTTNKKKMNAVPENEIEKLKKENEYLRAEVEFLKKWNAVVQSEEKRKKKK